MGMTIIEKIFARKAGLESVSPGDTVVVDVDMTVLIDLQFATMWIQPNRIHDPDKLAVVMDHAVPAPTIKDAAGGGHARKFVADFGIQRFYDVGRHGICHQVIAENGLARPGEILACTDSHTCAAGAYNKNIGINCAKRHCSAMLEKIKEQRRSTNISKESKVHPDVCHYNVHSKAEFSDMPAPVLFLQVTASSSSVSSRLPEQRCRLALRLV